MAGHDTSLLLGGGGCFALFAARNGGWMRVHPFQVLDVQFTSIYCFQVVRLNLYLIKLVLLMIFGKKGIS